MAVQVSGVNLAGSKVDPEPLQGIKTFVRDILPCRPHASPEGGTTPVLSDPGLEETCIDNSHLKRKSCLAVEESVDTDESDSEQLPSSKRQRITVSAMRRLFAKFSLSDTDEISQPVASEGLSRAASTPSGRGATSRQSPGREEAPESDSEITLDESREHNQDSSPNESSTATAKSEKRISETDSSEQHTDKRQRTNKPDGDCEETHDLDVREERKKEEEKQAEESDTEEADKAVVTSEDTSKTHKRQADTQESDTEDREETGSKVKRTRRLRRGLRLCTNITCYIEQVLYN